jgi:hypothetical protein
MLRRLLNRFFGISESAEESGPRGLDYLGPVNSTGKMDWWSCASCGRNFVFREERNDIEYCATVPVYCPLCGKGR